MQNLLDMILADVCKTANHVVPFIFFGGIYCIKGLLWILFYSVVVIIVALTSPLIFSCMSFSKFHVNNRLHPVANKLLSSFLSHFMEA